MRARSLGVSVIWYVGGACPLPRVAPLDLLVPLPLPLKAWVWDLFWLSGGLWLLFPPLEVGWFWRRPLDQERERLGCPWVFGWWLFAPGGNGIVCDWFGAESTKLLAKLVVCLVSVDKVSYQLEGCIGSFPVLTVNMLYQVLESIPSKKKINKIK